MYICIYCEITTKMNFCIFLQIAGKILPLVSAWITQLIKTKYAHSPGSLSPSPYSAYGMCISLNKPALSFSGFSRQRYWRSLPFPSAVDHVSWALSTMTQASWAAQHSMAHSAMSPSWILSCRKPGALTWRPIPRFPLGHDDSLEPPFFCNSTSWHLIGEENVANWEHKF